MYTCSLLLTLILSVRLDWEHLADMMHDYRGLLSGWPQILHVHSVRNALVPNYQSINHILSHSLNQSYSFPVVSRLNICVVHAV